MKLVLNFGHMLSARSTEFLRGELGEFQYLHMRLRVNFDDPLVPQISGMVDRVEAALEERGLPCLEQCELYVVMPSLDDPAVLLNIELFGRTGMFPNLLMLRREQGQYVIYEIVDCERVKLAARTKRKTQTIDPAPEEADRWPRRRGDAL